MFKLERRARASTRHTVLGAAVAGLVIAALAATFASASSVPVLTAIKGYVGAPVTLCPDPSGTVPSCSLRQAAVACPRGWLASGGAFDNDVSTNLGSVGYTNAYVGYAYNGGTTSDKIRAYVYCVHAGSARAPAADAGSLGTARLTQLRERERAAHRH